MYSGTRIDSYIPKNEEEARIIDLLILFQEAKAACHLEDYLSCLSDNGQFMFGGTIMVSKKELGKLLPGFWSDLAAGRLDAIPSSREELNGNFLAGTFYDPVIDIKNGMANVTLTFVTPVARWKTKLFLDVQKYNSSWKITRLKWDMG